jgi:hypothetical protein
MRFSSVPLGHKVIAVLLAAAVGGGVYTWMRRNANEKASTAELSFDMHAARRIDAGFVQASEPAVAFAQSVLTDQRIADLSKSAYLSTSEMMSRVGEFRSRLALTESKPPSGTVLEVQFRDPDATKAVETANMVAQALTKWVPSPNGPGALTEPTAAPAPAKAQTPADQPKPAAKPPVVQRAAAAPAKKPEVARENSGLATALGSLQEQLSSTSGKLEQLTRGEGSRGRSYAESEQQQVLKAQVRTAEQKVADLRAHAADGDKGRLGQIQQSLSAILAGGGVGVSESRLRRERDELTRAIGVVQEQRQAVEKEDRAASAEPAEETPAAPAPEPSATPAPAASANAGSGAIAENNLPGNGSQGSGSNGTDQSAAPPTQPASTGSTPMDQDPMMLDPLHMIRQAGGPAGPVEWWPAAAAAFVCGLLYWLIAAAAQPRYDDLEMATESGPSYGRFITPDVPVAITPAAEAPPVGGFDRGGRRASFSYERTPGGEAKSEVGSAVEEEVRTVEPVPEPMQDARSTPIFEEKVVEMDPWMDLMEKALSETEIGRLYGTQGAAEPKTDRDPARGFEPRTNQTDRRAS